MTSEVKYFTGLSWSWSYRVIVAKNLANTLRFMWRFSLFRKMNDKTKTKKHKRKKNSQTKQGRGEQTLSKGGMIGDLLLLSSEILVAVSCLPFPQQYDKVLSKSEEVQNATIRMTRDLEVTYEASMRNFPFFKPFSHPKKRRQSTLMASRIARSAIKSSAITWSAGLWS